MERVEKGVKPGRVLVIDDEPAIGASLCRLLGRRFEVVTMLEALPALQAIERGEVFDAILCDLTMPGMTGFELHEALSTLAPEQARRMLFLTGGAASEAAQQFIDGNSERCLLKPFPAAELRARVEALVAG
jgi:CheY-like chemotaxis protein